MRGAVASGQRTRGVGEGSYSRDHRPDCKQVCIADRGMASAANLALLHQTNRRYIIGAPKSELKQYATELAAAGWHPIREGIEVKLAR